MVRSVDEYLQLQLLVEQNVGSELARFDGGNADLPSALAWRQRRTFVMVIGLHRVSYLFEAESRIQLVPSICFLKKDKHLSSYLSQNLLFVTLLGL